MLETQTKKRKRKFKSKKLALIKKSREVMLAAVQIYNNPQITFKSEAFITLAIISWTYLLHAYYESIGIDYCYYKIKNGRKYYDRTKNHAKKHWELNKCLDNDKCPLDEDAIYNLKFLIGIRHEIEHQMTTCIDNAISAKLQACALNYNNAIKKLFDKKYGVDNELAFTIQFANPDPLKVKELSKMKGLAENVVNYITEFEKDLPDEIMKSSAYAYKIMYIPVNTNNKGQADSVVHHIKLSDDKAAEICEYVVLKDAEKPKFLPKQIVTMMKEEGYIKFNMYHHTCLWKKNPDNLNLKEYRHKVANKNWYWYENWVNYVRDYCSKNKSLFMEKNI